MCSAHTKGHNHQTKIHEWLQTKLAISSANRFSVSFSAKLLDDTNILIIAKTGRPMIKVLPISSEE